MFSLDHKEQNFKPSINNKVLNGEVNTPYSLINEMLDLIERDQPDVFKNSQSTWLDPACGYGYYMFALFNRLFIGLKDTIPNDDIREKHIIENMLFMCEINEDHINFVKKKFKYKSNVFSIDFLSTTLETFNKTSKGFDYIIGNPPYNTNGVKKVPTLKNINKRQDGYTIWDLFVKHSLSILNKNQKQSSICFIIPSIWMKPDKSDNYSLFLDTTYDLKYIKTFDNTTTKKIFKGQAQTPTCFFLLKNRENQNVKHEILLFDSLYNDYILYNHVKPKPIPLNFPYIFNALNILNCKSLSDIIIKTNMPNKKTLLSDVCDKQHKFKNIHTCCLNHNTPELQIKYSNLPCKYTNIPKIVLANKMYGFPYYDINGEYGISNRDSYVILLDDNSDYTEHEIQILIDYLNSPFIMLLFETTRYRMKYLEKYIFELLPNIIELERTYKLFENNFNYDVFINFLDLQPEYKDSINHILSTKNKYNKCKK